MLRRDFMRVLGVSGVSIWGSRYLTGCGSEEAAALDLSYPIQTNPPVLPGDSAKGWWMRGNYAPVDDEIEAFDLEILGELPPELNGFFLRNGPNPKAGDSSFWLMGDGMLHGVHLANGKALSYRNRWVQTQALENGEASLLSNLGNTALVKHGNKLLALYEAGVPHHMDAATLDTVGPYDFSKQLTGPMTAHPKIDPVTGEMFFIGYVPMPPYLRFHVVNPNGELVRSEDITLPRGVMMHDFQLTQNYVIFMDLPLVFDLSTIGTSPFPVTFDSSNGARIGVMPRTGSNKDIKWFDIDPCYSFHTMNAFETNDGKVILEACRMESMWDGGFSTVLPAGNPWEWTLDMNTGLATDRQLLDTFMDFPKIDERKQGIEHQIDYGLRLVEANQDYPLHPDGIVKYDRSNGSTDLWDCGYGVQPDEALFVPDPSDTGEDAGWLISMVYNRADDISEIVVLNAQELHKGPVARVKMPRRVPFGFHGLWVPENS